MTSIRRCLGISFVLTVVAWAFFTWPLPRHAGDVIPSTAFCRDSYSMATMVPGDNLQLMYHFWLAGDMAKGRTPLFHNLYEFNGGDDAERRRVAPYYVPFSLLYAAFESVGSRALAWNLTGLFSLWMSVALTWLLARRYAASDALAALFSVLAVAMPCRWGYLMSGSPTGFAMLWPPMLFLGLDIAVRDRRPMGGVLAGLALLFSNWTDPQTFFFCALASPAWCLVAAAASPSFAWTKLSSYLRSVLPLVPFAAFGLIAWISSKRLSAAFDRSGLSEGRTWNEVALYSPRWPALFDRGEHSLVFIGIVLTLVLVLAAIGAGVVAWRAGDRAVARRRMLVLGLVLAGIAGVAILSLGTYTLFEGKLWLAVRKVIPPFKMIRQPPKIFCLMPTLVAVGGAMAVDMAFGTERRRRAVAFAAVAVALISFEYGRIVNPDLCRLDRDQGAYRAIAEDAASRGMKTPRILVIPLWPGDSHFASVYEYYASMYRLRMLNGYSPTVPAKYVADVYEPYASVNRGELADSQLDRLRAIGCDYLVLHENLFPEKVSPFPVSFTLRQLLQHPRISLLAKDGAAWAMRIGDAGVPGARPVPLPDCEIIGCARRWEAEKCVTGEEPSFWTFEDPRCGGEAFARMAEGGQFIVTPGTHLTPAKGLRWSVRIRGQGTMQARVFYGDRIPPGKAALPGTWTNAPTGVAGPVVSLEINAAEWQWRDVPTEAGPGVASLSLVRSSGVVDCDMILATAGEPIRLEPGQMLTLPAACFFHGGDFVAEEQGVRFLGVRDSAGPVLYGMKLPLAPGTYAVEVDAVPGASGEGSIGEFRLEGVPGEEPRWTAIDGAGRGSGLYEWPQNLPANIVFVYSGKRDAVVRSISIRRLK